VPLLAFTACDGYVGVAVAREQSPSRASDRALALAACCGAVAFALSGCGGSGPHPAAATSAATEPVPIAFKSAALAGTDLPARYTCDGRNVSPPLQWGRVPASTRELALFAIGLQPTSSAGSFAASVEWALAGVNPSLHRLAAGALPPGGFLGARSDGRRDYSICPKPGVREQYRFFLYAIPRSFRVSRNFVGLPVIAAISKAGTSTSAAGVGVFEATYRRP
jgi:phosphatidylethanolamine-binding protein (PEBP) family uncharacterized protein